jgi:hypothetical protein
MMMNDTTEKTPEQIAAEADAKAKAAADKKAEKEAKAAQRKQASETKKLEKKAAAEKAKADKKAAAEQKKADAKAAREASKMPEQNGVRRPKPEGLCGKAWAVFDKISADSGAPATIGASLLAAKEQGLNEGNVRAEYARWRKFYGITGRAAPAKKAEVSAETAAQ